MTVNRRIQRRAGHGTPGDDLEDHGRESKDFTIKSQVDIANYLEFEAALESGQPRLSCPLGDYQVAVRRIVYQDDGHLTLDVTEDIE